MSSAKIDLASLSVDERLRLLEEVWESLRDDALPLTPEQQRELDRRLDELDADPDSRGIPWEDVLRRIRAGQ